MNKLILLGRIGSQPNTKEKVGYLSVATDEWAKGKKITTWHRIVCFGRCLKAIDQFAHVGGRVFVEAVLRNNQWTDKGGVKRFSVELIARDVKILDFLEKPSKSVAS